jgi:hypothetical protein
MKITIVYMRNLKPPSQKNIHLTPKARGPNLIGLKQDNRRGKKSNRRRRKGKSDGMMVMECMVL